MGSASVASIDGIRAVRRREPCVSPDRLNAGQWNQDRGGGGDGGSDRPSFKMASNSKAANFAGMRVTAAASKAGSAIQNAETHRAWRGQLFPQQSGVVFDDEPSWIKTDAALDAMPAMQWTAPPAAIDGRANGPAKKPIITKAVAARRRHIQIFIAQPIPDLSRLCKIALAAPPEEWRRHRATVMDRRGHPQMRWWRRQLIQC